MWNKQQIALKDFIIKHNSCFSQGFADAWQDPTNGVIRVGFGENERPIFPADFEGNYFYLRPAQKIGFKINPVYQMSECNKGYETNEAITLVAAVQNADPDILLHNLLYTLNAFPGNNIAIQSAIYENIFVILQELNKATKPERQAALSRNPTTTTLVSITFIMVNPFTQQKLNCIQNPCTAC